MKKVLKLIMTILMLVPMTVKADVAPFEPIEWYETDIGNLAIIIGIVLLVVSETIVIIIQNRKIKKLKNELESKKE